MHFANPSDISLATQAVNATLRGIQASQGTRIEVGVALVVGAIRDLRPRHQLGVARAVVKRILSVFEPIEEFAVGAVAEVRDFWQDQVSPGALRGTFGMGDLGLPH